MAAGSSDVEDEHQCCRPESYDVGKSHDAEDGHCAFGKGYNDGEAGVEEGRNGEKCH